MEDSENFRVVWPRPIYIGIAVILAFLLWFAWPEPASITVALIQILPIVVLLALPIKLSVNSDGLVWCGLFRFPWEQISSVRRVNVLGLPYLMILRHHGIRWWLPLYIKGETSLRNAVEKYAPKGSPIIEAVHTIQST